MTCTEMSSCPALVFGGITATTLQISSGVVRNNENEFTKNNPVGELVCALRGFFEQSPFATSDIIGHVTISSVIYALLCYMW